MGVSGRRDPAAGRVGGTIPARDDRTGWRRERARAAALDPYSVVLRLIARGDEPDYVAALDACA